MTPEKLFHQMLGLGNEWLVTGCRFAENDGVFLEIKEVPGLWEMLRCPKDDGEVFCYDHTEALEWRISHSSGASSLGRLEQALHPSF